MSCLIKYTSRCRRLFAFVNYMNYLYRAQFCVLLVYSSQRLRIEIASDCTRLTESALNSSLSFSKASKVIERKRNNDLISIDNCYVINIIWHLKPKGCTIKKWTGFQAYNSCSRAATEKRQSSAESS